LQRYNTPCGMKKGGGRIEQRRGCNKSRRLHAGTRGVPELEDTRGKYFNTVTSLAERNVTAEGVLGGWGPGQGSAWVGKPPVHTYALRGS